VHRPARISDYHNMFQSLMSRSNYIGANTKPQYPVGESYSYPRLPRTSYFPSRVPVLCGCTTAPARGHGLSRLSNCVVCWSALWLLTISQSCSCLSSDKSIYKIALSTSASGQDLIAKVLINQMSAFNYDCTSILCGPLPTCLELSMFHLS
jgi:hypothetical protein